jgi:large subunit ribosomal protein L25
VNSRTTRALKVEKTVDQVSIAAEPRSDFGKGAARRSRRAGLVPAVIYGHGQEPQHVALPDHDLALALRKPGVVLEVTVDGKTSLVAPRDIQRDPVKRVIEHVDLVVVTRKEADAIAAEAEAHAAELAAEDAHMLEVGTAETVEDTAADEAEAAAAEAAQA